MEFARLMMMQPLTDAFYVRKQNPHKAPPCCPFRSRILPKMGALSPWRGKM